MRGRILTALCGWSLIAGSLIAGSLTAGSLTAGSLAAQENPVAESSPESPKTARGVVLASGAEPEPLKIRVGLATDLASFDLACCGGDGYFLRTEDDQALAGASSVAPSKAVRSDVVYRPQVAALKDERQAMNLSETLSRDTGEPCDAIFDAGTDLYKVRCGRARVRAEADALRGRLLGLGVEQAWIATEGEGLKEPGFAVVVDGRELTVLGRRLEWHPPEGGDLVYDGTRYRGVLVFFLNERGRLNVVNELPLEDYLRGVVPKEMGPELYPQIEALKAQAVAARTYAIRHLGEFENEGYDLCSTPRCQVYGGRSVEHPRSDRALADTSGQVLLYEGTLAETFYSATCGGHTEDVEVVFPLRRGEHLRGVPCIEAGTSVLQGDGASGAPFPEDLMRRLLPVSRGAEAQVLTARFEHLARLARVPVPDDAVALLGRREVWRYVTSLFDLAIDPRLIGADAELMRSPPSDWGDAERRLADWLDRVGMLTDAASLDESEIENLLFEISLYLGVLQRERVHVRALTDARLDVRDAAGKTVRHDLAAGLAVYGPRGDGTIVAASLTLMPGDRLDLYRHDGRTAAVVLPEALTPVRLSEKQSKRLQWREIHSAADLRRSVQALYPGFPWVDFEILERGSSGRVRLLRLQGSRGETILVEGLAVRWTLDLPETWFTVRRGGDDSWIFDGRGWGHGVGLCQTGAFAMAVRGLRYDEILQHYFSGAVLGRARLRRGD